MDEFEDLKPQNVHIEMERWNVQDLKEYILKLEGELSKVKKILDQKKDVNSSASALFNE